MCAWLISGPRRGKQACPEVRVSGRSLSLLQSNTPNPACQAITILNNRTSSDTECQRCGACCLKGGPGLHEADAALFHGPEALALSFVVTFRAGEPVHDQVLGRIAPLEREMLKLRPQPGTTACAHYNHKAHACTLYRRRPLECRTLSCRNTAALAEMYDKTRLRRSDLLPQGHPVLAVMAEHEALVPVARIAGLAAAFLAGGPQAKKAEEALTRMALCDQAFRQKLTQLANIGPEFHDFFFGRDARALFAAAGLSLRPDARLGLRVQPDPLCTAQPWRT